MGTDFPGRSEAPGEFSEGPGAFSVAVARLLDGRSGQPTQSHSAAPFSASNARVATTGRTRRRSAGSGMRFRLGTLLESTGSCPKGWRENHSIVGLPGGARGGLKTAGQSGLCPLDRPNESAPSSGVPTVLRSICVKFCYITVACGLERAEDVRLKGVRASKNNGNGCSRFPLEALP